MELVSPGIGLIFWMTLSFLLLMLILGKFAWKPVLKMLKERENKIEDSLKQAEKAHEEMKQLKFSNEELLREAKNERDNILREARVIREKLIEEARTKATEEADRIVQSAKDSIKYEKIEALTDLKNQIALLSVEIAEKLLQEELSKDEKQNKLIEKFLNEINFN
ncbi:MAG TPA: F0F1 ATP synthase subunit B [Bacteroidales bacterium]|nr:F0F1 ATP synthase subunit B [Bacteroidales bacterium]HQN15301.1 F0F1 ATP synthase subunit B [Bacteroidales bacterium]HQP14668.1 F0F1 ATP synthase subunit B [Bacteroidales bacterium]